MAVTSLLRPLRLGAIDLRNRIVMAPMARRRADADGVPGRLMAEYYAQRASAGLLVTEAAAVVPAARAPHAPGIGTRAQVDGWRAVAAAVHARGGRIVLQLAHAGHASAAASPLALAPNDIAALVDAFADAAARAMDAGFDGVEILAGGGDLVDRFLQDGTNRRIDAYGGSFAHRARLLLEIVDAAAAVAGRERVGVRLSPFGHAEGMHDARPLQLFLHVVGALERAGVGYLHLVEAHASLAESTDEPCRNGLNNARLFRASFRGPLVSAGGYDPAGAGSAVADGIADAIAFGRLFIANPDLVERIARHRPLQPFDRATFHQGGARGYTDYSPYRG